MDIDDENIFNGADAEQEAIIMPRTEKILVYDLHVLLNQFELHLDNFIHKYKILALRWLLATFAAVGFLFSVALSNAKVNGLVMVSIVCLFGIIGITAIWHTDLYVFHKFWAAFFIEEVKMEKKHEFLTKIRDTSLSLDSVKTRIVGHQNFYIFSNLILALTGGISLNFLFHERIAKIGVCCAIILFCLIMIRLMSKGGEKLQKTLMILLEDNETTQGD